jgi:hypothetical protein
VQAAIAWIHQIKTLQNQLFFLKIKQRRPPPPKNKTKKEKKTQKQKSIVEIERREQIAQNPKLFHEKKNPTQLEKWKEETKLPKAQNVFSRFHKKKQKKQKKR